MKTKAFLLLMLFVTTSCILKAQDVPTVQGTWKLIKSSGNPLPEGYINIKMITPTHFIWTMIDKEKNIVTGAAGSYTIKNGVYAETILYTLPGMQAWKGKNASYKVAIKGKEMTISGFLTFNEEKKVFNEEMWEKME